MKVFCSIFLIFLCFLVVAMGSGPCDNLSNSVYSSGSCQCVQGYYLNASSACTYCPQDTSKSSVGNSSSLCTACSFGTWTNHNTGQTSCTVKPGFIDMGNGAYACPSTTGYNSTSGFCALCPVDTYSPVAITTPCYSCPTNTTTFIYTGLNFCWSTNSYILTQEGIICASGSGYSGGLCSFCPVDYYKEYTGNSSCIACPSGYTTNSIIGSSSIEYCVVSQNATSSPSSSSSSVGAIVGGVAAGFIVVAAATSGFVVFMHQKKRSQQEEQYYAGSSKENSQQLNSGRANTSLGMSSVKQNSLNADLLRLTGTANHSCTTGQLNSPNNSQNHYGSQNPYANVSLTSISHGAGPHSNGLNGTAHNDTSARITGPVSTGSVPKSVGSAHSHSAQLPVLGILDQGNNSKQMLEAFGTNGMETLAIIRNILNNSRFAPTQNFAPNLFPIPSNATIGSSSEAVETPSADLPSNDSKAKYADAHPEVREDGSSDSSSTHSYDQVSTSILGMYQTAKYEGGTISMLDKSKRVGSSGAIPGTKNGNGKPNGKDAEYYAGGSGSRGIGKHATMNSTQLPRSMSPMSATKTTCVPQQMVLAFPAFLQINSETGMRTIEKFAEGGFAILYKGELLDKSVLPAQYASLAKNVAIKIFKNKEKRAVGRNLLLSGELSSNSATSINGQKDLLADLENEASIMYALNFSPNVARLLAVSKKPQLALVMQMYEESLASLLHQINSQTRDYALAAVNNCPIRLISYFSHDIVAALQSIHSLGVAHLDIKPSNMLIERVYNLNENRTKFLYRIVVCDFGLARILNESNSLKAPQKKLSNGISFHYAAPESFSVIRKLEAGIVIPPLSFFKMDMFSLSTTVNEMLTREIPFRETPPADIEMRLLKGERPSTQSIPQPDNDQETLRLLYLLEIIRLGWSANPDDRADANHIFQLANEMINVFTA